MKHSTFIWFFSPTALAMILFIAFPIVSVLVQSVHAPHKAVLVEVETCTPLVGCTIETSIDQEATRELREEKPIGRFIGLEIFSDRGHLAISEVKESWSSSTNLNEFFKKLGNLPFYRAMLPALYSAFVALESCVKKSGFIYSERDFIILSALIPASEFTEGLAVPASKCEPP